MFKSLLDDILLLKAGRVAKTLLLREREVRENQKGSISSSQIPSGFENKNSIDDIRRLNSAFSEYDRQNNTGERCAWTWSSVFLVILKTFKRLYGIYFLLFLVNLAISYFVKRQAKEFFNSFTSEDSPRQNYENLLHGLLFVALQVFGIIFTTHCEYYNSWIHYKVRAAISGSSLLRFIECNRLRNKQGLCVLDNNSSSEILSLYQNIILVDSEFTEYYISNSINILLYPVHIITSVMVAYSALGGRPLLICLLVLLTCFSISAAAQYISSLYKKPFLRAREERIEETTRILEQSKYISLTHQLFPTIQRLISKSRDSELYYNSLRKYICMVGEIFDNWINLACNLSIGLYILYNKLPLSQASIMIIQSAWIIPHFYQPLNDMIFLIYFMVEGKISMERIAQFLFFTQLNSNSQTLMDDPPAPSSEPCTMVSDITLHDITFSRGKNTEPSALHVNLKLSLGVPCFVIGKVSSGKSALLEGIAGFLFNMPACQSGHAGKDPLGGKFSITLENGQTESFYDISSRFTIEYVPEFLWIPSGFPLSDLILCGHRYDESLWRAVLHQCDLEVDFLNWGIRSFEDAKRQVFTDKQFSAGQKVRLSIARAIYSSLSGNRRRPRLFLIDCVLKSLDPFVCKIVMERLFAKNGLLADSISIIVIEPPILEFVSKASSNCGFSYKVVSMSDKKIAHTEEFVAESPQISLEKASSLTDTLVTGHVEAEKGPAGLSPKSRVCSDREETVSQIDIQKNKFSYYYPTNYFYMFIAGTRRAIDTYYNKGGFSWSNFEPFIMAFMLVLPAVIAKLGESLFLVSLNGGEGADLSWDSNGLLEPRKTGLLGSLLFGIPSFLGCNVLSFWSSFYNTSLMISMISVCIVLLLEIRIGFRAAKYFHNSVLLSYLGATPNSILRFLPLSFILNRLSNDQLQIDYCITRRIRSVIIILNSVIISVIPLVFGSLNSLLTLGFALIIGISVYKLLIRYFINGCRTLRSSYISEYSPLVDTIQTIGKGKKCIISSDVRDFFFQTSVERIDSVLKPLFVQIGLDAWFKMRIKILITVPTTLINIVLPYISSNYDSSARSALALAMATVSGLAPLLSTLVGYWTKLETELVSVERSRLYLAASREAGLEYLLDLNEEAQTNKQQVTEIKLENVEAKHSKLESQDRKNFDNSNLVGTRVIHSTALRGITAKFQAGEVVGIVGRTGSGKTTLLDVLSGILACTGGKMTVSVADKQEWDIRDKLERLGFFLQEFDSVILRSVMKFQEDLSHIALLPLEIYFPKNGNVRDIVDPIREYDLKNIKAALNICGFGPYIKEDENSACQIDNEQESPLLGSEDEDKAVSRFLETELAEIGFGIPQMRMLLFVSFFLKRDKLRILLVDEPPVFLREHGGDVRGPSEDINDGDSSGEHGHSSSSPGCMLSSIIHQYFKHCITFIVSHDNRNLQYISRILILRNGRSIKDAQFNKNSLSNSQLYNFVKTNLD